MKIKKIFQAILPCKETRLWFLFLVAVELFILWTLFVFPNYVKTNCSPQELEAVLYAILILHFAFLCIPWFLVIKNWKDPSGWDNEFNPGKIIKK